jgi:hypothetical protein
MDSSETCAEQDKFSETPKCCQLHVLWNSRLVLFLTRGGSLILCVVILVIGGLLSQQTLSLSHYGNSTDCHVISNYTFGP